MKIFCVDIDGSIADLKHRLHFIKGAHKNYDAFFDAMSEDAPIENVIEIVERLSVFYSIVFISGRPDSHRKQTFDWLEKHVCDDPILCMRKAGDHRRDDIIKLELLDEILLDYNIRLEDVVGVIDDRPRVLAAWRSKGLTTFKVGDWDIEEKQQIPRRRIPTLTLMVAPSRAGKSSYIYANYLQDQTISSDNLRLQMTGDMLDQSHNDAVFQYMHDTVELRLKNGLDTVIDATNLRNKDRKAYLKTADKDVKIRYIVLDRPLEDKIRDAGSIPVSVIEKHDNTFKSNLKDILNGDGDSRVEVLDYRSNK